MKPSVAIIGAGISGLSLAHMLRPAFDVTVFEKARGVGGRMATRYADPFYFDHGAQCFTARTREFQQFLVPHCEAGTVAEWQGKVITLQEGYKPTKRLWFEKHLVATPNMNSLCKALAADVQVQLSTEVAPLPAARTPQGWALHDKDGRALGEFSQVVSTAPPAQTQRLFGEHLPPGSKLEQARYYGCYALMIGLPTPWPHAWIAAKLRDCPLKWVSVNSSKPGRNAAVTALVAHSRNNWAEAHIDDDVEEAGAFLRAQLEAITGLDTSGATYFSTHRWRYAIVDETAKAGPYYDAQLGLASTSDWCATSRIEEAWLSARELAQQMLS
jgi:renalase